jgi:hypothetical protein
MKTFIQLVLATSMILVGCMTDSDQPTRTISAGKYVNNSIGLTITFPSTWQIKPDQVILDTKLDIVALGAPINSFSPNLNVVIESHSGPTSMAVIIPSIFSQLAQRTPDLSNYRDSVYSMNGKEIGEIEYESSSNGTILHYFQIFFINNGKDVSLSIADRADNFAANQEIKEIKASIKVK